MLWDLLLVTRMLNFVVWDLLLGWITRILNQIVGHQHRDPINSPDELIKKEKEKRFWCCGAKHKNKNNWHVFTNKLVRVCILQCLWICIVIQKDGTNVVDWTEGQKQLYRLPWYLVNVFEPRNRINYVKENGQITTAKVDVLNI